MLDLCCSVGFSLVVVRVGCSLVAVHRLLIVVAFLIAKLSLGPEASVAEALDHRLNRSGARAYLLHPMGDPTGSGIEPGFPALAGGFPTTGPLGKPAYLFYICAVCCA